MYMNSKYKGKPADNDFPSVFPAPAVLAALRAAAEPSRLRLLALLAEGELAVGEIAEVLNQSQPRISRHLKLLAEAGLIERTPERAWVFNRLAREALGGRLAAWLRTVLDVGRDAPAEDRARLAAVRAKRARAAAAYFRANAKNWDSLRRMHADDAEVERALVGLLAGPVGRESLGDLLDLGTGTGRMLEVLGPLAARCEGLDLSHDMLTLARAALARAGLVHGSVRHGDLYRLPYAEDSFDVAVVHQVLHFLDEPLRAIAEAARVLRPGGRLAIADFAPHEVEELRERHAHRRLGFAEGEVLGWCRDAGLDPVGVALIPGRPLTVTLWLARKPKIGDAKAALARWTVRAPQIQPQS
jgi:ubiquinone/menaquinone biosynthesis C-methylase UbiE/DNA-binding transcriptional ArsR family regulator